MAIDPADKRHIEYEIKQKQGYLSALENSDDASSQREAERLRKEIENLKLRLNW